MKKKNKTKKENINVDGSRTNSNLIKCSGNLSSVQDFRTSSKSLEVVESEYNKGKFTAINQNSKSKIEIDCDEKGNVYKMKKDGTKIKSNIKALCGVNETKFLLLALKKLNDINHIDNKTIKDFRSLNRYIKITKKEAAELLGIEIDIESIVKNNEGITLEMAKKISKSNSTKLTRMLSESYSRLYAVDFTEILEEKNRQSNFRLLQSMDNYRGFRLTEEFVEYIFTGKIKFSSIDKRLLTISARQSNAFYIGLYITNRENIKNNIIKGTENILKLENILNNCPDIPTIEEVRKSETRNWERKILTPIQNALEELVRVGVIKNYYYSLPKKVKKEDISFTDFEDFKETYLVWELSEPIYDKEVIKTTYKKRKEKEKKKEVKGKKAIKEEVVSPVKEKEESDPFDFSSLPEFLN